MADRTEDSFAEIVHRIRSGSADAIDLLVERYGHHVLRAVRRKLAPQLRSRFDSQDFTQAVWASFFSRASLIGRFSREDELLAFLIRIASNKVVDEFRAHVDAQRRSVLRERSLDDDNDPVGWELGAGPTPSEFAVANEQWDRLVRDLPPRQRQMLELRRAGSTVDEIARQLEVHERTVRRVFDRLAKKVHQ